MKKGTVTMLKKKYYDGFTVHDILSKHLDDGRKILELLTAFADADGVDAVPVRHGKWITKSTGGEFFDCCSECGYVEWDALNKYCPHCGSRMDKE